MIRPDDQDRPGPRVQILGRAAAPKAPTTPDRVRPERVRFVAGRKIMGGQCVQTLRETRWLIREG